MSASAPRPSAEVVQRLARERVVAVLRADDPETALQAGTALVDGGLGMLEVTFTVPAATEVIAELRQERPAAVVGAGTVVDTAEVDAAIAAGADFLVSPGSPPAILAVPEAGGPLTIPGVASPTEYLVARDAGCEVVKLFPAATAGPRWIRQLLGPFPDAQVVPTGGIGLDDLGTWLAAGAVAVGLGSSLCSAEDLSEARWSVLHERASRLRSALGGPVDDR